MICADVRLTEFTNHQPHDASIPDPLLRDAVSRPAGGHEEVAKVEVNVGGEGSDLFNKSFTWGGPNVGEGLIKFIPSLLYSDILRSKEDSLKWFFGCRKKLGFTCRYPNHVYIE